MHLLYNKTKKCVMNSSYYSLAKMYTSSQVKFIRPTIIENVKKCPQ